MTWSEAKNSPLHCAVAIAINRMHRRCPVSPCQPERKRHGKLLGQRREQHPDFRLSDVEQTAINQTFAADGFHHGPHQLWLGGPGNQQPPLHLLPCA